MTLSFQQQIIEDHQRDEAHGNEQQAGREGGHIVFWFLNRQTENFRKAGTQIEKPANSIR